MKEPGQTMRTTDSEKKIVSKFAKILKCFLKLCRPCRKKKTVLENPV